MWTCVVKGIKRTDRIQSPNTEEPSVEGESLGGGWEQVGEAGTLYFMLSVRFTCIIHMAVLTCNFLN